LRSAIADQLFPTAGKFIALGVPAKIVMVVQHQDFCARSRLLPVKIGRRQPADAAARNDQVVGVFLFLRIQPCLSVAQGMAHFPGTIVASAHARLRRRIVVGHLFRCVVRIRRAQHLPQNRVGNRQ
jgi:hypothetical protein